RTSRRFAGNREGGAAHGARRGRIRGGDTDPAGVTRLSTCSTPSAPSSCSRQWRCSISPTPQACASGPPQRRLSWTSSCWLSTCARADEPPPLRRTGAGRVPDSYSRKRLRACACSRKPPNDRVESKRLLTRNLESTARHPSAGGGSLPGLCRGGYPTRLPSLRRAEGGVRRRVVKRGGECRCPPTPPAQVVRS